MEKLNTIQKIVIPKKWDKSKSQELLETLKNISNKDIKIIGKESEKSIKMKNKAQKIKEKEDRKREERLRKELQQKKVELWWFEQWIIDYTKEHFVKTESDAEYIDEKWELIHLELPAVWSFKWYKKDFFISFRGFNWDRYDNTPKFINNSFSKEKMDEILLVLADYLREFWITFNYDVTHQSVIWHEPLIMLWKILGISQWYRLKDSTVREHSGKSIFNHSMVDFDTWSIKTGDPKEYYQLLLEVSK